MRLKPPAIAVSVVIWVLLVTACPAPAQEMSPSPSSGPYASPQVDPQDDGAHIDFSKSDSWTRTMILSILLGLFIPAAIIGPWVRRHSAAEIPELHDREERSPLSASQHEPGHNRPK